MEIDNPNDSMGTAFQQKLADDLLSNPQEYQADGEKLANDEATFQ